MPAEVRSNFAELVDDGDWSAASASPILFASCSLLSVMLIVTVTDNCGFTSAGWKRAPDAAALCVIAKLLSAMKEALERCVAWAEPDDDCHDFRLLVNTVAEALSVHLARSATSRISRRCTPQDAPAAELNSARTATYTTGGPATGGGGESDVSAKPTPLTS